MIIYNKYIFSAHNKKFIDNHVKNIYLFAIIKKNHDFMFFFMFFIT